MRIGVCGNYGVKNIGDEAILRSLKQMLSRAFSGCEIIVFGKGRLFPFGIRSFLKSIIKLNLWREPYKALKSCDMFILGGGGLFSDEEGPFVSLFWALHGVFALFLKKPVLCLGISVSHIRYCNRLVLEAVFKRSRLITVRDAASFNLLKKWGIKSYISSDLALLYQYQKRVQNVSEKYIVLSLRRCKIDDDFLCTIFAQVCDSLIAKYGFQIRLIPFQDGADKDTYLMNKIFDRCREKKHISIEPYNKNISDLLDIISGAELVLAMRLHAGIFSLLAETPFIPISYMSKVEDFWSNCEGVKPVKLDDLTPQKLLEAFDEIMEKKSSLKAKMILLKKKLIEKAASILTIWRDMLY